MEKTFRIILLNILVFLFLLPKTNFAISAPELLSPSDNSTVSSSKLEWQAPTDELYPTNPYRVQVDDNSDFSSTYRDEYKTNTYYSPVLFNGVWFWRIKAKDSAGSWSEWSSIWSFTLSTSNPSLTPTVPAELYSTPYSTPDLSLNPTPTSTSSKSSFIISDVPSSVDSDKSFTTSVELSLPNSPSTTFYLKGAFKKADSSNYFGFTKIGSSWVKNGASYSSQYKITTDSAGNWSGNLEIKPDDSDSGFTGTGDYIFKVGRYSSSGSGPTWSNEETLNINGVAISSEEDSDTTAETTTYSSPQGSIIKPPSNKTNLTSPKNKQASVAGISLEASASSDSSVPQIQGEQKVKDNSVFNYLPIAGGAILILSGLGSLVYIYRKQKIKSL